MPDNRSEDVLESLERIDVERLTLGDIRKISNPALRIVLAELVSEAVGVKPEHTSHGMHTNHLKSEILERPLAELPVVNPG